MEPSVYSSVLGKHVGKQKHVVVIGGRQPLLEQENDLYTDFVIGIFLDRWTGVTHRWRFCSHATCTGCGSFHLQYSHWPWRSSLANINNKRNKRMISLRVSVNVLLAAAFLAGSLSLPSGADEITTVRTTTVTSDGLSVPLVTLSPGGNYVVIDPVTGVMKGVYDPLRGLVGSSVSPGFVVVDNTSNRVVATFDGGGRVIALTNAPAYDSLVVSIDSRRAELERMIVSGRSANNFGDVTAVALREELASIAAQESAYRSSGRPLNYEEALSLANRLNALGDRVVPYMRGVTVTPLIGSRFVTSSGNLVILDELTARNMRMQRRVDDEYAAGRLSNDNVARLKSQLNEVSSLQTKYTRNGKLKDSNSKRIVVKLDKVQTSMDRNIADINAKRSRIGIKVN